jgi:ribonuclease P protein component
MPARWKPRNSSTVALLDFLAQRTHPPIIHSSIFFWGEGTVREAHVSAEDASSRASARFSRADEDDGRPQGAASTSRAWTEAPDGRLNDLADVNAARLRRSTDIAAVREIGRPVRDAAFIARLRPNDLSAMRLAVSAPRTVGIATIRNRARRRVREAFRQACAAAEATPAQDIVVTVRRDAISAEFSALRAAAAAALGTARQSRA